MQRRKVLIFWILMVIIQAMAAGYLFKNDIHAVIKADLSIRELQKILGKAESKFSDEAPVDLGSIEKVPLQQFKVQVPISNWRWVNENVATDKPRTKIPAKLEVDGKFYDCTIRISRGSPRHWMGERKSIRLRFPKESLYNGIRELNLNIPETKMVIIDAVAWEFARRIGLPTPDFDFVKLEINGKDEGVRLLYEDVDGFFLRRHKMMGYIFTEDRFNFPFQYYSSNDKDYPWVKVINKKGSTLDELRNLCKVLSYPSNEQFKEQIVKLIDWDEVAKWHAHALICGSGHQNVHNIKLFFNSALQKFQLIPWDIAGFSHWGDWPNRPRKIWAMNLDWATNNFIFRLNQIPEFVEERNQNLWKYLQGPLSVENQLNIVENYFNKVKYHFYIDKFKQASEKRFTNQEFDRANDSLKNWIRLRSKFILNQLENADLKVSISPLLKSAQLEKNGLGGKVVDGVVFSLGTGKQSGVVLKKIRIPVPAARFNPDKVKLFLDANANNQFDLADREIEVFSKKTYSKSNKKLLELSIKQKLLPARKPFRDDFFDNPDKGFVLQTRPFYRYYQLLLVYLKGSENINNQGVFSKDIKDVQLECDNSITGKAVRPEYLVFDKEKQFALMYKESNANTGMGFAQDTKFRRGQEEKKAQFIDLTTFIKKFRKNKKIRIPAGKYILKQNWRIEKGDTITLLAATEIRIHPGVSILVRGVLNVAGRPDNPVIFANAFPGQPWGTLAFYQTKYVSRMKNAIIRYAGMANIDNMHFTGAVSIYDATVILDSFSFENIQADDAVNVKNSNTKIMNSAFIEPKDDAIDYDFSNGEIRNNYFYKSGGDAIDCGTANPLIEGNIIEYSEDKGISVGESSSPKIVNNYLYGGHYGIAIKDDSNPFILNNTIVGNDIGISFYIKKPDEFGRPTATISKTIVWDNKKEIENLCDAKFSISESVIKGGYHGKNIFIDAPQFTTNSKGLKYILGRTSYYFQKGIGAKTGSAE